MKQYIGLVTRSFSSLVALTLVVAFVAAPYRAAGADIKAPPTFTIAYQPGLGYATFLIIKQEQWIEKDFPQTKVDWRELGNGAAIRDGMIANQIQVGVVGTAPYLVGWGKGVDWKLIGCASNMDLWLMAVDPAIKSLKDFKPGMQIALPAPDSIQAFVLRKGAQDQLGNAHALDAYMVALPHPEGMAALLNHQVTAHLTSPPFEFEEADKGAHQVYSSNDAFGDTTFNAATMTTSFYDQYPDFAAKFLAYMRRADKLIQTDVTTAAKYTAQAEGQPQLAGQYKAWMTRKGIAYTVVPTGFLKYAAFMKSIGTFDKELTNVKDIELPPLAALGGS